MGCHGSKLDESVGGTPTEAGETPALPAHLKYATNFKNTSLTHAGDLESLVFEEGADFGGLVALKFDGAPADGAAAAAGVAQTAAEFFDGSEADVRGKIVNHDDDFAAAMGGFAAQDHAAGFGNAGGGRGGRRGRGWAGGEAVGF